MKVLSFMIMLLVASLPARAETKAEEYQRHWIHGVPTDPSEAWEIAYGGRLYDQWAEVLDKNLPTTPHPAYPASGKAKAPATWRCKECHGWDYKGAAGAYGPGSSSHTGIKGIRAYAGGDPKAVVAIIRDATHRYTPEMIPDAAAARLALFVTKGQVDTDTVIDPATKKVIGGNPDRGMAVFQNLCAICHGFDGKAQNLGGSNAVAYVGTIATRNPWELLHKVRNGYPGFPMPSNIWWDAGLLTDVATYAQTLPTN